MPMTGRKLLTYKANDGSDFLRHTEFSKSPTHRNRLQAILELIPAITANGQKPHILEVGCGTGNIAIPLASLGFEITGIDIHEGSIAATRERNVFPNATFECRALENTDLAPYDVIILTEVLEHVSAYHGMLDYFSANMRPDATFIVTVPNGWCISELVCRPSYAIKQFRWGGKLVKAIKRILKTKDLTTANEQTPHVNFFTLRRLQREFTEHGFAIDSFAAAFLWWVLRETLFSERAMSEEKAARDFEKSQRASPALCAFWVFAVRRTTPA